MDGRKMNGPRRNNESESLDSKMFYFRIVVLGDACALFTLMRGERAFEWMMLHSRSAFISLLIAFRKFLPPRETIGARYFAS
jgi:hypothetical protein